MRIARSTLIGTAVPIALVGESAALYPQTVAQPPSDGAPPAQATGADQASKPCDLVVTGIRYSMQQSIAHKHTGTNVTEVQLSP